MPQINANLTLNTAQAQAAFDQFVRRVNSGKISQPLGRISGDAAEFNKSMQAATARVTAFGLSAGAIIQVKNAITAAANATIEVDKQLVELNTFLGQSTSELDKFSKSLFRVAKNTAAPFSEAAGAAKEFARQGLSVNEVLQRTESALTLARISGLDFKDSVQGITTAINSFGKEALKDIEIINKLIAVDTRFAVSSADLNEAIRRVGSSAEESGVGFDSLIAAVTAAQQTTGRGGAVIGNALKTIFTRLQRPEVLSQLEQLGITIKDQNGFLLDGIGILKNFSDATKNLSQAERSRTAELIGGVYQINQLNALIKDLSSSNSIYANSLRISNSATDEAAKKNEELNKSMSSMLQGIKNTATEVASSFGSSFLRPIVQIGSMVSEGLLNKISPSEVGSKLGLELIKGLSGALGEGLSKTALPMLASIGGLLAVKLGGFGGAAFKELGKASSEIFTNKKDLELQKRINDVVAKNPGIIMAIIAGKKTQAQAEAQILDFILKQNQQLRIQSSLSRSTFNNVMLAQKAAPRKKISGTFADGYLPNFAMSMAAKEVSQAKNFGAKNPVPKLVNATIKGKTQPVMVNSEEDVIPNFAGTGDTAIIPRYRKMQDIPRMGSGYVPNFSWSKTNKIPKEFLAKYPESKAAIKAGRMYSPEVRVMLQKLQSGENIDRGLLEALIERDIPIREVAAPSSAKNLPSESLIRKALDKEQAKRVGKLSELPAGSSISVRQDVPSMTRKGVGVVKTLGPEGFKSYDSFVAFDNPVMNKSTALEKASLAIGAGANKSPLLKISGTLSENQSLPKDLNSWTQVGFNPDRHSYYYDRKTKKPVVGGSKAIQIGNTVFVKDAISGKKEDFLYAGGRIPNIPNYVPNAANLKISKVQLANLLKTKQFQSITYKKSDGSVAKYNAAQHRVRRDKLVGASAPAGYKNWTEYDNATGTIVLHTSKQGEAEAKFRRFSIDGIQQLRSGGNTYDIYASGYIPNFAKRKDIIQRLGKKEIFARFQKHFEKGKDYQRFYEIHAEEYAKKGLSEEERRIHANITSAISPRLPDYIAAQFSGPIFNRFMETRSTNVDDYLDLPPAKKVSRHETLGGTGDMGRKGEIALSGKPRDRDDVRRYGLSKALKGLDLGSHDTAKTRHYARAILQDKTAFPIDTNVIEAILGGKTPTPNEAAKLISLANEFATLNKIETGASGLQAAIFKSNSKFAEQYTLDTVRSALSGIKGRAGGYVPNFAKILLAAKYYDALKVGKAKAVKISKSGDIAITGREVFGGIGFSNSRIGKGYASAVRSTTPTTSLERTSREAGVTKSIIVPVVAPSAVNDPIPQNLTTNEALLQQFLANHPNSKQVISDLSSKGFNVKKILKSHSGSEIKSIIDILNSDKSNRSILTQSAQELKDPALVKFFAPGGVKARGPKGSYAFGSSIAFTQPSGKYAIKQPGRHKSYPILIAGKAGPQVSEPVNAEEIFPGISDRKSRMFFASAQSFGTRVLDTDNPEHIKLLGRLGYSPQRLQQENLMAGGYIPNFAGLSDAINREKMMTGLPASQIMAHFDGKGNPTAVTNKRDEPNGLKDVPNFAIPKSLTKLLDTRKPELINPISGTGELFAVNVVNALLNQLAENEIISTDVAVGSTAGIPILIGAKNILEALVSKKASKGQKIAAGLTGAAQAGFGLLSGTSAKTDLEKRISDKKYSEALDRSRTSFENLTENTTELADTFAKLESAYADPQADPKTIAKLAKKQEELLGKISFKNPDLIAKLASEADLSKKQTIIEESKKEAQRQQSIREQSLKFVSQGGVSGKDAPEKISDFFTSIINSGNAELLNQSLSNAKTSDFANIIKKGGLDVEEFSKIFQTDELKKSFIDGLVVAQKLAQLSNEQSSVVRQLSKPLIEKKQKIEDARAVRLAVSSSLKEQLPELASFAGGFSRRAGISAASDAELAITRSEAFVAFSNNLMSQLADSKFSDGLPVSARNRLLAIQSPSAQTGRELESLKTLPGLSKEQVAGIEKLIGFNNQQNRKLETANKIANESKNIQLKFLALQEKLAFGGDIRSSIDPEARAEAMSSAIRGPLTYQLGGLLGSRRTQIGGATDFITDTIKKYPGLLQTKDGKEPADIQALKRELTGLNAMDMQRDLLKRASMAEMMGLGQTGSLLRSKAFDRNYLLESAGLKAAALFSSPEIPEEVQRAMKDYEKFNVEGARQFKAEEKDLKNAEDLFAPIRQAITEKLTKEGSELAKAFKVSLTETFGKTAEIKTDLVNIITKQINKDDANKNTQNASTAYPGLGGLMPAGVSSNANGLTKYSSSIADAVKREKTALASRGIMGVPNFAMADINLERSPDLVNFSNPFGFGVTNSVDEKNGLRSLGMRSSGFVPNYALPSWMNTGNFDKARTALTGADDAQSLVGNIKEGDAGGAAMDLVGPALDAAKFVAKKAAAKTVLGAAGLGLDIGEYAVKPLSEKLGITDYLADRMYNILYAKPEKSNIARASDAYNSKLGDDLIDPSPEWMKKKERIPNFAKPNVGSRVDDLLKRIYPLEKDMPKSAAPSIPAPIQGVSQKTMPFFPERLVNETYPFGNRPSMGNVNPTVKPGPILSAQDPSTGKFLSKSEADLRRRIEQGRTAKAAQRAQLAQGSPAGFSSYLKKPGLQEMLALTPEEQIRLRPRAARPSMSNVNPFGRVLTKEEVRAFAIKDAREAKAANLYKRNLLTELERATRPAGVNPIFARTARESALAQIGASRYAERQALLSKLASPIFDQALDPAKKMSAQELQNRLKITTERPASPNSINAQKRRLAEALKAETLKQAEQNRRQNLANKYFQSTADARAEMKAFSEARQARLGGAAQSGGASLENYLARKDQLTAYEDALKRGEGRASFRSDYEQMLKKAKARGLTEEQIARNISRQKPSFNIFQGEARPTLAGAAKIASGQLGKTPSAKESGLLSSIAKSIPASGNLGKAIGIGAKGLGIAGGAGFGVMKGVEAYTAAKEGESGKAALAGLSSAASFASLIKGAGKVAGPAGVVLGGLTDLNVKDLTLASDWKDIFGRKEEGQSIGLGGVVGTGLSALASAPATVALLGYRTGNILENKLRLGDRLGDFASVIASGGRSLGLTSGPIRGMKSKEAYDSDQITVRKLELIQEINRYNRAAGNPEISVGENLLKSKKAQKIKDEKDLEALKNKLEEESVAAKAAMDKRIEGKVSADMDELNKESETEDEGRKSKLRKIFLESFDKNAESAGYSTTLDKINYLLSQEGKNGLGSFKSTDFKDPEFARSFNNYKRAREAEAAREADRVIPKSVIEFRNRPMPSFPQDVLEEAVRTRRSAERVMQDREERNIRSGATSQGMSIPEINAQMSRDYTSATGLQDFPKDVLEEAVRRRVTAEQVMEERARGKVPNFAAMSNGMMTSSDVYAKMRISTPRVSMSSAAQGIVPNFAMGEFSNAITEAMKNGITSAFPNGGSSSSVSNSNVINIDGRTSIQNAPDEAIQGIIGILFDKFPELKKLGPSALNFKR